MFGATSNAPYRPTAAGSGNDGRTDIAWFIHRNRGQQPKGALGTNPRNTPFGRVNIAFVDGHVDMVSSEEVADFTLNRSKFRALWNPRDRALQGN
jgi:prepilin-type processing-associated H-X9-DG protein